MSVDIYGIFPLTRVTCTNSWSGLELPYSRSFVRSRRTQNDFWYCKTAVSGCSVATVGLERPGVVLNVAL